MKFKDRKDAALRLAEKLKGHRKTGSIVLAIPRGGVPVGYHLAGELELPLDIFLSKKIGHPLNPEVAIGSVTLDGVYLDTDGTRYVDEEYVQGEVKRLTTILQDRYSRFAQDRKEADVQHKTVIIVDDGIATGSTMLAAIKSLRSKGAGKIVVAVPVGPADRIDKIKEACDEFICLYAAEQFYGVGQFYSDFSEVTDDMVIELLEKSKTFASKNA